MIDDYNKRCTGYSTLIAFKFLTTLGKKIGEISYKISEF